MSTEKPIVDYDTLVYMVVEEIQAWEWGKEGWKVVFSGPRQLAFDITEELYRIYGTDNVKMDPATSEVSVNFPPLPPPKPRVVTSGVSSVCIGNGNLAEDNGPPAIGYGSGWY